MTIWKAIAALITKLADWIPTPCGHDWADQYPVKQVHYTPQYPNGLVTGKRMTQRCTKCQKFRTLKMW